MPKLKRVSGGHEQSFIADGFTEMEATKRIAAL